MIFKQLLKTGTILRFKLPNRFRIRANWTSDEYTRYIMFANDQRWFSLLTIQALTAYDMPHSVQILK